MLPLGYKQSEHYKQALLLAKEIYRITEGFPDSERTVLVYTLRRLAVLLCQDIAIAAFKQGKKGQRLFKACLEQCVSIDTQLELALAINLTTEKDMHEAARLLQIVYNHIARHLRNGDSS